jgi:subtilase family serine protease
MGGVPGSQPIELDVALRPRDPVELASFVSAVSSPYSPDFRRYLRPGAFGPRFGATAATLRATMTMLEKLGMRVDSVTSNHLIIEASSTAATAERAFATKLVRYRLGSGAFVYSNLSAPRLPTAAAGGILAIAGLSDLPMSRPHLSFSRRKAAARLEPVKATIAVTAGPNPCQEVSSAVSSAGGYTANQLASAYGFSGLYAGGDFGAGETIAIFELEPVSASDISYYDDCYFPSQAAVMASHFHVFDVDGSPPGGRPTDVESTLDVEDVSSFAPQATIDVYRGRNNDTGPIDVYSAIVSQDRAQVISTSWGTCEALDGGSQFMAVEANLFEEAAAQGQTVIAASGDNGSTDCGPFAAAAVDDPSSQPYVTGVGGTSLTSIGPPVKETVWNSDDGASGGGISANWAMPAYQSDAPASLRVIKSYSSPKPCSAPAGYCREVPDVAADADPNTGLEIYWSGWGGWATVGGTSIAAPLWAALVALTNAWPACSTHPVGFLNPSLYSIAGSSQYLSAFNDVTTGNNVSSYLPTWWRYPATVGYDLATGLGTPDAANGSGGGLVTRLCELPESGGALYASPTRSSITAVGHRIRADRSSFSTITVILRTKRDIPIAAKRVWLVATTTSGAAIRTRIYPMSRMTNSKGVAIFEVSDTVVQKVVYRATDLTDGVLLYPSVTVNYVTP